jgi:hypothetical protein
VAKLKLGLIVVGVALAAAGCGSSSNEAATTTASPPSAGPGHVLYQGSAWAVVLHDGKAVAKHLVDGSWVADRSRAVKVSVLGPKAGSTGNPRRPQVAAELKAASPFVESALWVDGVELLEKGGELTPAHGTIYGAPASPLRPGRHTAVAYARTSTHATAVAWTFSV